MERLIEHQTTSENLRQIGNYFDHFQDSWKRPYAGRREGVFDYRPIQIREDRAMAMISAEPKSTAVDLGCGVGHALVRMKEAGFDRVIGVDISSKMLEDARGLLASRNLTGAVELYPADVRDLKMIESGSVTACTALGVIEYHREDAPLLNEMYRILHPGGVGVVQVRNFYCLQTRTWSLVRKIIPRYRSKIQYREHRPRMLREALGKAGFRIEEEIYFHYFALYPLSAIPLLQILVKPLSNLLSRAFERLGHRSISVLLAASFMVKVRKPERPKSPA